MDFISNLAFMDPQLSNKIQSKQQGSYFSFMDMQTHQNFYVEDHHELIGDFDCDFKIDMGTMVIGWFGIFKPTIFWYHIWANKFIGIDYVIPWEEMSN